MLTITMSARAMSYEQARREALFLTDKMAYELNLNDSQYDAAYEINLDYLMGVTSRDDVYGTYWTQRNLDISYILLDWQWRAFQAATYFYRPLYWSAGYWHFGIYARYPRRDYFYFGRPTVYVSYRGGHSWHHNGGRSYYYNRRNDFHKSGTSGHVGLRDKWNSGDLHTTPGSRKNSSTHVTVNRGDNNRGTSGFGSSHTSGSFGTRPATGTTSRPSTSTSRPSSTTSRPATTIRPTTGGSSGSTFGSSRNTITPRTSTTSTSSGTTSLRVGSSSLGTVHRSTTTSPSRTTMQRQTAPVTRNVHSSTVRSSAGSRSSGSFGSSRSGSVSRSSGSSHSGGNSSKGGFGSRR